MSRKKPYKPAATQPAQSAAVTSPAAIQQTAAQPEEKIVLQFGEGEVSISDISAKVKEDYRQAGNEGEIKDIKIYIKPEDNKAYYVINTVEGNVDLIQTEND